MNKSPLSSPSQPTPTSPRASTPPGFAGGSPMARPGVAAAASPAVAPTPEAPARDTTRERKLIVGRDIVMSGEIAACDQLIVEGRVEAKVENAHRLEIADTGEAKGTITVQEADIAGHFEGDLTVKSRLTIRANGRVEGKVNYGDLAVEAGGRITGQIEFIESTDNSDKQDKPQQTESASSPSAQADGTPSEDRQDEQNQQEQQHQQEHAA